MKAIILGIMFFLSSQSVADNYIAYDIRGRKIAEAKEENGEIVFSKKVPDGIYFLEPSGKAIVINNKVHIRDSGDIKPLRYPVVTKFTVNVDKPGFVYQGFPFKKGVVRRTHSVHVKHNNLSLPTEFEPTMFWPGGSVKMAFVGFYAHEAGNYDVTVTPWVRAVPIEFRQSQKAPFLINLNGTTFEPLYENEVSKTQIDDLLVTIYTRRNMDGSTRSYLLITNKTPCNTSSSGWQPKCAEYGELTDRSASLSLISSNTLNIRYEEHIDVVRDGSFVRLMSGQEQLGVLRAGESRAWEITTGQDAEPPLALAHRDYYAESGIFDLAPYPATENYDSNVLVGIDHIYDDRTSRTWWSNSRDFGEDYRDWDTPDDGGQYWGTHNDEFEANFGYLTQSLRLAGTDQDLLARKAYRLAETGAIHHATVDVNAISVEESHPNIRWMAGSNWQHTSHGDRGLRDAHRNVEFSPHMSHANGRACLWMFLFSGNPLMLDGFRWISENVHWRSENLQSDDLDGEARIAGNALGIVLDAYEMGLYPERSYNVAKLIVQEQMTREVYYDYTAHKAKPWMVSIFAIQLARARDLFNDSYFATQYETVCGFLVSTIQTDSNGNTYIPYKVNPLSGSHGDMWSVVGADALADYDQEIARELFETGSAHIWYPNHPIGVYSKLLQHTVLNLYGGRILSYEN